MKDIQQQGIPCQKQSQWQVLAWQLDLDWDNVSFFLFNQVKLLIEPELLVSNLTSEQEKKCKDRKKKVTALSGTD